LPWRGADVPHWGKVEDNLIAMGKFVDKICTEQKVDLIVFPELVTTGYELGVQFTDVAERPGGPATNLLAQRAASTAPTSSLDW